MSPTAHHGDALREIMISRVSIRVQVSLKSSQKLLGMLLLPVRLVLIQHNRPVCKNTLASRKKFERRAKRAYAVLACLMLSMAVMIAPAFATDDPLQIVANLSDFIFSLIRAIGLILLGFGILQVGLSFQSHDPSQRSNGILTIAGGIVITFTKEILTLITS